MLHQVSVMYYFDYFCSEFKCATLERGQRDDLHTVSWLVFFVAKMQRFHSSFHHATRTKVEEGLSTDPILFIVFHLNMEDNL